MGKLVPFGARRVMAGERETVGVVPCTGGSLDPEPDTQSPFFDAHAPRQSPAHGGQACGSYGAAEFTRDLNLAIVASLRNIAALRKAMLDLRAEVIAVPPFEMKYLRKGHAVHFRCHDPKRKACVWT